MSKQCWSFMSNSFKCLFLKILNRICMHSSVDVNHLNGICNAAI